MRRALRHGNVGSSGQVHGTSALVVMIAPYDSLREASKVEEHTTNGVRQMLLESALLILAKHSHRSEGHTAQ